MRERIARVITNGVHYDVPPDAIADGVLAEMEAPTREMWLGWRSVNCKTGTGGMEEFTYFEGDYGNWLACHQAMIRAARAGR